MRNTIALIKARQAKGFEIFTVKGLRLKNLPCQLTPDDWVVATCQATDYDPKAKKYVFCDKMLVRILRFMSS